ncbi:SCO6880 family protein [Pimelobacter sp. 30-1]|uniref:SCO6880 family protein n=1 Tax=Pimelobacter sp. 30-1 TaxID=2004991 RepID=UPI0035ABBE46
MTQERPLYGNFIEQRSSGLKGSGSIGTAVLLVAMCVTAIALIAGGVMTGAIVGGLATLGFLSTTRTARRIGQRIGFLVGRAQGEHQWRSGVFSRNSQPECRLPGMLGTLRVLERSDAFGEHGERFAVVKNPRMGGQYTVVVKCVADGPSMQDQQQINAWVASYSHVLAAMGHEPALVCGKAITDTAPDPGGRLATMVESGRAEGAPAIARTIIDQVVAAAPATSSENVTYVELTFRGRMLNRKGKEDVILSELARRVPNLRARLAEAGGGAVSMVKAAELAAIVRVAYDPATQPFLEQASLAGYTDSVPWADAGPVASQESWGEFLHDSGRSVTWEMLEAPRAAVTERSFTALLAPRSDFARKRVALIYRPHTPAEAAEVSENDVDAAVFNADQGKKRISARSKRKVNATERSRDEVAGGAGMTRFYALITATVLADDRGDLDQAVSTIESNAAAVLMGLRRSYGSQAAAFAATLPVGFVPWEHTVVPDSIREQL